MKIKNLSMLILIVILGLVWIFPLLWPIATSLRTVDSFYRNPNLFFPTSGFTTSNYNQSVDVTPIARWYLNSFLISGVVTIVVVIVDFFAAYPLSRMNFWGKRLVYFIVIAGLMIPFTVLLVPLYDFINKLGLVNTYWGIILPQFVSPFGVFLLANYLLSIPKELEESARIDGANSFRIALNIILPNSIPGIITVAIFTFLGAWNNLLWPIVAAQNPMLYTLTAGLTTAANVNAPTYIAQSATDSIIAGIPLFLFFFVIQKYIISGISLQSGMK